MGLEAGGWGDAEEEEKEEEKIPHMCNSRKSFRWSAVPVPCLSRLCLKLKGEQGSGPKGFDYLCFHLYEEFSPSPPPPPPSPPHPPPPSHEAHISASRTISQP